MKDDPALLQARELSSAIMSEILVRKLEPRAVCTALTTVLISYLECVDPKGDPYESIIGAVKTARLLAKHKGQS